MCTSESKFDGIWMPEQCKITEPMLSTSKANDSAKSSSAGCRWTNTSAEQGGKGKASAAEEDWGARLE
jgi:hypothetical protein